MIVSGQTVTTFADYLRMTEPERQVGDASEGIGWIGDYGRDAHGKDRILALDTYGNVELRRVRATDGYGDESAMRRVAADFGWSWIALAFPDREPKYLCNGCVTWLEYADHGDHVLHCECTPDEPCETMRSRYDVSHNAEIEPESTPLQSGVWDCAVCGAHEYGAPEYAAINL